MTLVNFDKTRNLGIDRWMNDFFAPVFEDAAIAGRFAANVPAVNIAETSDAFEIELVAPGLKKSDFKINLEKDVLTVSAQIESETQESEKKFSKREYNFSSFKRSFTLPENIDQQNIDANYQDGVLRVLVAKKESEKEVSRLIEVQ